MREFLLGFGDDFRENFGIIKNDAYMPYLVSLTSELTGAVARSAQGTNSGQ